jgi:hypothetical protein
VRCESRGSIVKCVRLRRVAPERFPYSSAALVRIFFKLRQRRVHFVPCVRVTCPHVHLGLEPAGIIQAGRSDGNELRNGIGFDHDRRATVRAKASASHAALVARRRMKARRALQDVECFRRYDDVRRKRAPGGSLTIAAVTVKHRNRCSSGLIADRATSAATGERSWCAHTLFVSFRRLAPVLGKVRVTNVAGSSGPVGMSSCSSEGCMGGRAS